MLQQKTLFDRKNAWGYGQMGMEHADVSSMDTKESSLTIFDST